MERIFSFKSSPLIIVWKQFFHIIWFPLNVRNF